MAGVQEFEISRRDTRRSNAHSPIGKHRSCEVSLSNHSLLSGAFRNEKIERVLHEKISTCNLIDVSFDGSEFGIKVLV